MKRKNGWKTLKKYIKKSEIGLQKASLKSQRFRRKVIKSPISKFAVGLSEGVIGAIGFAPAYPKRRNRRQK